MHSSFVNDPTVAEFYPRRLYTHHTPQSAPFRQGGFCIVNNTASLAYRDWDPATGVEGLVPHLREYHQPRGDGSKAELLEIGQFMIDQACTHGHIEPDGRGGYRGKVLTD